MKTAKPLLVILLVIGLLWLKSSYGKITGGTFVTSLGATLTKVADKNPNLWFKQFLISTAIPNSQLFGLLVLWGELLCGIAITLGSILLLFQSKPNRMVGLMLGAGLVAGFLLNINFWLGFGYSNPSTDSLNLLMAAIEVIGLVSLLTSKQA